MIEAKLIAIQTYVFECCSKSCQHNPKYHHKLINDTFLLKPGTTCLHIWSEDPNLDFSATYCQDCVDRMGLHLKPLFNTDLWPFI